MKCAAIRPLSLQAMRNKIAHSVLALSATLLAACAAPPESGPIPPGIAQKGLVFERSLPSELPAESAAFPGSQFVLISPDNVAGMFVPLPFVADAVAGAWHHHAAVRLAQHYQDIDPFDIVRKSMAGSPLLAQAGGIKAMPFAYLVDCSDGRYRVALVTRMQEGNWTGRYMVHLPASYGEADIAAAGAGTVARLRQDMEQAASDLRMLIERDARRELSHTLYHADVGSLHLACSNISGVVTPTVMLARHAAIVDETSTHLIVRAGGDLRQSGPSGGLMFGLHYLRKDQLHTFRRNPGP